MPLTRKPSQKNAIPLILSQLYSVHQFRILSFYSGKNTKCELPSPLYSHSGIVLKERPTSSWWFGWFTRRLKLNFKHDNLYSNAFMEINHPKPSEYQAEFEKLFNEGESVEGHPSHLKNHPRKGLNFSSLIHFLPCNPPNNIPFLFPDLAKGFPRISG